MRSQPALYGGGHCGPEISVLIRSVGRCTARLLRAHLLSKIPAVWRHHNLGALFGHHESFVQGNGVPGQL